jgi:hypothetical protein
VVSEEWGEVTNAWWRRERETGVAVPDLDNPGETVPEWELFVINSPVVFHYDSKEFRLAVTFRFSYALRNASSPGWNTHRGPRVDEVTGGSLRPVV